MYSSSSSSSSSLNAGAGVGVAGMGMGLGGGSGAAHTEAEAFDRLVAESQPALELITTLFDFLGALCAGHNMRARSFLREQRLSGDTVNLVAESASLVFTTCSYALTLMTFVQNRTFASKVAPPVHPSQGACVCICGIVSLSLSLSLDRSLTSCLNKTNSQEDGPPLHRLAPQPPQVCAPGRFAPRRGPRLRLPDGDGAGPLPREPGTWMCVCIVR